MNQIQHLEDSSRYRRHVSVEETSQMVPVFVKPLKSLGDLHEGQCAHFEAQLQPVSDPFLRVEWYHNGKSLTASK